MLEFFRKYQRYFFLVITIVTIISFSFFGTYSTLENNTWREQIAFKAINGKDMTRSDVDEMALFLATDNEDKLLYGGVWGPNFLNDGVIRKDFLETGLAQELVLAYQAELQDDLQKRLEKERKYTAYIHPQARFLSAQNVWEYFIPEMNTYFQLLRSSTNAVDPASFSARVNLFLVERKFPSPNLRQVLRYQERQYNWLNHDQALDQSDLSMFGYHTTEDWFGPSFTRLISQFIINAAILAEQKGYQVSRAEVLADLVRRTELSYQQNKDNPSLGVASPEEYLNEQLRRLNMDQARAIKIWRQVLLFRRYFHDAGQSSLADVLTYQKFNDFAQESLTLDLYQMPAEFRFGDYSTLQNFEAYLAAVSNGKRTNSLALPDRFLTVKEVEKTYPELVQKTYLLEVAQVDTKNFSPRISLKETWNWEVEDQNWTQLKQQFPDLGMAKGETRQDRFDALDALDGITRAKVDVFARAAIVKSHPEWLEKALDEAQPKQMRIGLLIQGGKTPFNGLDTKTKREELIRLLDTASLNEEPAQGSKLSTFTGDQESYYRIKVIERAKDPEILTFAEAQNEGVLDAVKQRILERYYESNRAQSPLLYQKEDKSWKGFATVRELVTDQYFDKTLKELEQVNKEVTENSPTGSVSKDQLASLRFYPHLSRVKTELEKDPAQSATLTQAPGTGSSPSIKRRSLSDQWLVEKSEQQIDRSKQQKGSYAKEAFSLPLNGWSNIRSPINGELSFFQVKERGVNSEKEVAIAQQTREAQALLSADAQRILMKHVLQEIIAKKAISLAYLTAPSEPQESPPVVPTGEME